MDKGTVLEVISHFKKAIESKGIRVNRLILFGSYATGRHSEGSDIDIVVISKDFIGKDYWERLDILSDAIYEVFQPIEAVAMTPEEFESETSLIVEYAKKGEVLFAA